MRGATLPIAESSRLNREQLDTRPRFLNEGKTKESVMPVLLWAVPAVIFVGGVGYFLVRAVH
jgi:hypothetical protein